MQQSKTQLYDVHKRLGAKIVDFHGWLMPIQYIGVVEEHNCVREKAGIFDVSHMGEFLVFGTSAADFMNQLITNDLEKIEDDQCLYSPMCKEDGTIIDDLIVYKHNNEHLMVVVNASNIEKDYNWISSHAKDYTKDSKELSVRNVSDTKALIALQGPKAEEILSELTDYDLSKIKKFRFSEDVVFGEVKAIVSRTGYTGEDGFEIYVSSKDAHEVWDDIMKAGTPKGLKPCGLGARDTLRLEAALMLYGNDIDDKTTPLEAAIEWTVKFDKKDFKGKTALQKQKNEGVKKKLVGFELTERGIPRQGYKVYAKNKEIGVVTSGSYSPTLKKGIGLAYVRPDYAPEGSEFTVLIRDTQHAAKAVKLPFYKRT